MADPCVPTASRSYDTADDPGLYSRPDPVLGFSSQDVADAMLGSFVGTYTPQSGEPFSIDVSLSVDGVVQVQDFEGEDCPSVWSAVLVFAISSDKVGDRYLIDDLWSPELVLEGLDAGTLAGSKPADEFDGAFTATGEVVIEARFAAGSWVGTMRFGDERHGTFTVTRGMSSLPTEP